MEKIHKRIFQKVSLHYELLLGLCTNLQEKNHFFKELLQNYLVFTAFLLFTFNCTEQPLSEKVSF